MIFELYLKKAVKEVVIKTHECISRSGEMWSMSHSSESKKQTNKQEVGGPSPKRP